MIMKKTTVIPHNTTVKFQVIGGKKGEKSNKEKWREIFNTKDGNKYEIWELDDARKGLLSLKSAAMQRYDYKYKLVIGKLFKRLRYGEIEKRVYFDLLQYSFRTIINNDDTEELEKLHLAMVEALFEWEIMYTMDSAHYKSPDEYGEQWSNIIDHISFLVLKECKRFADPLFPRFS